MTKQKKEPNKYAKDLRTPKYKMRIVKDKRHKTRYKKESETS